MRCRVVYESRPIAYAKGHCNARRRSPSHLGPRASHFSRFFKRDHTVASRHSLGIVEYSEGDVTDFMYPSSAGPAEYIQRAALGLCKIYNMLPAAVVESSSMVSCLSFRASCRTLLRIAAQVGSRIRNSYSIQDIRGTSLENGQLT